jgi:hypothetical protein
VGPGHGRKRREQKGKKIGYRRMGTQQTAEVEEYGMIHDVTV